MREILRDAEKIDELWHQLYCDTVEPDCEISDFRDEEIISEAHFVLSKYGLDDHALEWDYSGRDGPESKKRAQREVRQLKRFLKKYDKN